MTVETSTNNNLEEYKKLILEGVANFLNSEKWKEYLTFHTKFWQYSFNNTMLIFLQNKQSTFVAGERKWKKLGRKIKNSEIGKPIYILAPVFRKIEIEEEGTVEVAEKLDGFTPVSVYDIEQTYGNEIPSICQDLSGTADEDKLAYTLYCLLAQSIQIPVTQVAINDGSNGFYNNQEKIIEINKSLGNLHKFKTLIHENTHYILHKEPDKKVSTQQKEIEAESVAFIVCKHFGLNTDEYSFEYLSAWNESELNEFTNYWERIQRTAKKIISTIEENKSIIK